jgi:deoxyribose-phosphate aldolase
MSHERNPGTALNLGWVEDIHVNKSAVERRAATIGTRRTVKKEWQLAWLLKAMTLIDLTTLAGDDTPGNVKRLCAKARRPIREDLLEALGVQHRNITTGAVCVYHDLVKTAVHELEGTNVPVAAVSTGFPAGLVPLDTRLEEIRRSVADGAKEIDIVIHRAQVLTNDWQSLYEEVRAMREACGAAHMKAILATGELGTLRNVAKASWVCMMAGSDFIKTSTGKESVNATLPFTLVMVRAIREYAARTGYKVGYKPAGGIRTAKQALEYMYLMKDELGREWLEPDLFRFGASALVADIERQLEFHVTGRYAAFHRHPMA